MKFVEDRVGSIALENVVMKTMFIGPCIILIVE